MGAEEVTKSAQQSSATARGVGGVRAAARRVVGCAPSRRPHTRPPRPPARPPAPRITPRRRPARPQPFESLHRLPAPPTRCRTLGAHAHTRATPPRWRRRPAAAGRSPTAGSRHCCWHWCSRPPRRRPQVGQGQPCGRGAASEGRRRRFAGLSDRRRPHRREPPAAAQAGRLRPGARVCAAATAGRRRRLGLPPPAAPAAAAAAAPAAPRVAVTPACALRSPSSPHHPTPPQPNPNPTPPPPHPTPPHPHPPISRL
jgi:hypothetical protein